MNRFARVSPPCVAGRRNGRGPIQSGGREAVKPATAYWPVDELPEPTGAIAGTPTVYVPELENPVSRISLKLRGLSSICQNTMPEPKLEVATVTPAPAIEDVTAPPTMTSDAQPVRLPVTTPVFWLITKRKPSQKPSNLMFTVLFGTSGPANRTGEATARAAAARVSFFIVILLHVSVARLSGDEDTSSKNKLQWRRCRDSPLTGIRGSAAEEWRQHADVAARERTGSLLLGSGADVSPARHSNHGVGRCSRAQGRPGQSRRLSEVQHPRATARSAAHERPDDGIAGEGAVHVAVGIVSFHAASVVEAYRIPDLRDMRQARGKAESIYAKTVESGLRPRKCASLGSQSDHRDVVPANDSWHRATIRAVGIRRHNCNGRTRPGSVRCIAVPVPRHEHPVRIERSTEFDDAVRRRDDDASLDEGRRANKGVRADVEEQFSGCTKWELLVCAPLKGVSPDCRKRVAGCAVLLRDNFLVHQCRRYGRSQKHRALFPVTIATGEEGRLAAALRRHQGLDQSILRRLLRRPEGPR